MGVFLLRLFRGNLGSFWKRVDFGVFLLRLFRGIFGPLFLPFSENWPFFEILGVPPQNDPLFWGVLKTPPFYLFLGISNNYVKYPIFTDFRSYYGISQK
jgi:hypothetical protein